MSAGPTEDRIRQLAHELRPVRPTPRLRAVGAAALGVWLLVLVVEFLLGGSPVGLRGREAWADPSFLAAFAGLALLAAGATLAALARAVPGREASARFGAWAAGSGFALAVLGGAWGILEGGASGAHTQLGSCFACMSRAAMLGVPTALLACGFIVYAVLRRPGVDTALALLGGVALGALAVHATCPDDSSLHQLVAHTFAPVAVALVLTLPLAALASRAARR